MAPCALLVQASCHEFAGVRGPVSLFSHLLANPRRLKVKVPGICIQMSNLPVLRLQNLTLGETIRRADVPNRLSVRAR